MSSAMGSGVLTSVWLVCAVLAALTLGVLMAYGLVVGMFQVFRIHARQVQARRQASPATQVRLAGN